MVTSAHALGHARGVDAGRPATEHDDLARQHARHAAEQDAAAAVVFGQKIASHQDRHAPGDFAHRLQERKPVVEFNRLVSQRGHARLQQILGQAAVRRQVQVGEQDLPAAEQRAFRGLRFFHLHH